MEQNHNRHAGVKHVYLGGYASLALLNVTCAVTQNIPLLMLCCFLTGFIRIALVLNTTFVIAPYMTGIQTLDMFLHEPATPEAAYKNDHAHTVLMPVIYCYILCIVQFSNYVSAWVAYEFRWEYTYFLVAGMTLAAMKDITGHTAWMCLGGVAFALLLPYYKQEKT